MSTPRRSDRVKSQQATPSTITAARVDETSADSTSELGSEATSDATSEATIKPELPSNLMLESSWKFDCPSAAKEERREALGVTAYQHIDQEGIELAHAWNIAPGSEAWVERMTYYVPGSPVTTPSSMGAVVDGFEQSDTPNFLTTPVMSHIKARNDLLGTPSTPAKRKIDDSIYEESAGQQDKRQKTTRATPEHGSTPSNGRVTEKSDSGDDYEDDDYETSDDDFEIEIKEEDQGNNSDGRPFKGPYASCEWCMKGFTRAAHARRHVRDQHNKTITNTCEGCGRDFYRRDNWQAHKRGCKILNGKK